MSVARNPQENTHYNQPEEVSTMQAFIGPLALMTVLLWTMPGVGFLKDWGQHDSVPAREVWHECFTESFTWSLSACLSLTTLLWVILGSFTGAFFANSIFVAIAMVAHLVRPVFTSERPNDIYKIGAVISLGSFISLGVMLFVWLSSLRPVPEAPND